MAIKAIICGVSAGGHDATVQAEFERESGLSSSEIQHVEADGFTSIEEALTTADSLGATIIVRSGGDINTNIQYAENYYPDILVVMPLGSNNYVELATPTSIPVIVSTAAGIETSGSNQTGYGVGLEFWDRESVAPDSVASSSWSNGIIAGKLYSIKVGRNCSWWEARYCARKTASQKGIWDKYNGYGLINVADAIAFSGTIPLDPYDETLVTGMERTSDNFKFWGQTDVTFAELTKSFEYYERISGL